MRPALIGNLPTSRNRPHLGRSHLVSEALKLTELFNEPAMLFNEQAIHLPQMIQTVANLIAIHRTAPKKLENQKAQHYVYATAKKVHLLGGARYPLWAIVQTCFFELKWLRLPDQASPAPLRQAGGLAVQGKTRQGRLHWATSAGLAMNILASTVEDAHDPIDILVRAGGST